MPEITQKDDHQMFHHDIQVGMKEISQKVPAHVSGTQWFFIGDEQPDMDNDTHELNQGKTHMQMQRCESAEQLQNMD